MKIQRIYLKNYKNIPELEKDLQGKSIWVLAQNGKGKTSCIQSIFSILSGKELAPNPLKTGEEKGSVRIEFGEGETQYIAELKFSEKNQKGTLTLTSADGSKFNSPRGMLDKMVGDIIFDPFDLIRMKPKEMLEKVKQILGIDFSELDKKYQTKFDERTLVNREVSNYKGIVDKSGLTSDDFEKYAEEIDVVALTEEKEKLNKVISDAKDYTEKATNLTEKITELQAQNEDYESQIKVLQQKVEANNKSIKEKDEERYRYEESPVHKDAESVKPRLEEITNELSKATDHNNKHKKVLETKNAKDTLKTKEEKSAELTKELEQITSDKKKKMKSVNLPVEGLEIGTDSLLYNGLVFCEEQISKAKIMEVGYKLSVHLHKDLKIMRTDASFMDDNTLNEFLRFANENDYQVFVEQVDTESNKLQLKFIEE